ncbi:AbrB/MazE/SpoVT family DNA-binding domain-containing protein [Aneurinibacillus sp. Ricciae_BoGa-3]|uniref:AbrB/MazE/SpoVT family DNA-binding domain-containing protein n=1 Tax=Aneurinibacillus sp. Ricciae_BoGa-3 TaxID=3022697 RepID=UPI0023413F9A|nr:AbrB/MazE/SpoVT family DNA-binding domain-containing protein [Aneurinibacillus sp. Ricciae_BoGa-3]WCK52733.1 AbrB/MazE/SpoVT family DNA-binding domain-containing protein [Aneurinibacillus sp. Ricciae_BoGa-3]
MTMKATGVVRKVDELGRVVIPIELRRNLGIAEKDGLEIFVDDEKIILKRYAPACIFCDSAEDIRNFKGRNVCSHCIQEITAE